MTQLTFILFSHEEGLEGLIPDLEHLLHGSHCQITAIMDG